MSSLKCQVRVRARPDPGYLRPSAQSADDVFPLPSSAVKSFFVLFAIFVVSRQGGGRSPPYRCRQYHVPPVNPS